MTVQSAEYKSRIGLDKLYYALVSEDSATAYTVGANTYLAPAAEASAEPTTNIETQYADDTVYDVMTAEGETKITLSVTNVSPETLASLTGKIFDSDHGRLFDNNATPPYCALSFRSMKSNGKYRYYQYLKGRFESPAEEFTTKGETPEPKPVELTFTAIYTIYEWTIGSVTDGLKRVIGDEDATNFDGGTWFNEVQVPGVAPSASPSLSPSASVSPSVSPSGA